MTMQSKQTHGKWWGEYSDSIPAAYLSFIQDEQRARRIQSFSQSVVPGLLQTESYARAVCKTTVLHDQHPEKTNRMVTVRMQRQWHIFEHPSPPVLAFLLDQSALYRQVGGVDDLHEQLVHLKNVAGLPFVELNILPFARDAFGRFFFDNFSLLEFGDEGSGQHLYFESMATGMAKHTASEMTAQYANLFERLRLSALDQQQSIALIEQTLGKLESGHRPQP